MPLLEFRRNVQPAAFYNTAAAEGMAKSFVDTSLWNTEVWCVPCKHGGASGEHEAETRRMTVPGGKAEKSGVSYPIRKPCVIWPKEWMS